MVAFKYEEYVHKSDSDAFDTLYQPKAKAPLTGIYRCAGCAHEIIVEKGAVLPSQHHALHQRGKPVLWQLMVLAHQNLPMREMEAAR